MKKALSALFNSRHLPAAAISVAGRKDYNASAGSHWLALALLLLLSAATVASAAERPVVREVLVSKEGTGARIEIKADRALVYKSYPMPGLEKWVVDLPGAKTTFAGDESKKMRTPPLERITVRQKEVNGDYFTRIGFDYKGTVDFSLKEDLLDKGHLIVIIKPAQASPQKGTAETSPPTPPKARTDLLQK